MPASVSQVATGLKNRLDTIAGLRVYAYQPDQNSTVPVGFPVLDEVVYHNAFRGGDVVMNWTIFITVGRYVDRTAYALLDEYLSYDGAKSVRAALEADKTLGGVCQTLIVQSSVDVTSLSQADAEFLQIRFRVQVHA